MQLPSLAADQDSYSLTGQQWSFALARKLVAKQLYRLHQNHRGIH
jgi:hypothetical protein